MSVIQNFLLATPEGYQISRQLQEIANVSISEPEKLTFMGRLIKNAIVGNVLGKRNHTTIMYHHNQKNLKIGYWKPQNEIWNIYEEINNEL